MDSPTGYFSPLAHIRDSKSRQDHPSTPKGYSVSPRRYGVGAGAVHTFFCKPVAGRASHGLGYRRHVPCSGAQCAGKDVLGFSRFISARVVAFDVGNRLAQASRVRRGVGRSRCTALTRLCRAGDYVMLLVPLRLAPGFAPTRQAPFKKARVGATTPAS